jgi:hypothetical protein
VAGESRLKDYHKGAGEDGAGEDVYQIVITIKENEICFRLKKAQFVFQVPDSK